MKTIEQHGDVSLPRTAFGHRTLDSARQMNTRPAGFGSPVSFLTLRSSRSERAVGRFAGQAPQFNLGQPHLQTAEDPTSLQAVL